MERKYTLSRPITTHGGEITEITLKMPTARLFRKYGMPYTSIREGEIDNPRIEFKFNTSVMFKFIEDMSGLDELTLDGIAANDVQPLFYEVVGLLNTDPRFAST